MQRRQRHFVFSCDYTNSTFTMDDPSPKSINKKKYFLQRVGRITNKTIPLPVGVYKVGRNKSAHVVIPSKFCNRKHCRLIVDCESVSIFVDGEMHRGGVYVNEKRYKSGKIVLHEGDKIGFGNPTNLTKDEIAFYMDQVHIYEVKCVSTPLNLINNKLTAKLIPLPVMRKFASSARPPTPPKAATSEHDMSHDDSTKEIETAAIGANTSASQITTNETHAGATELADDKSLNENRKKCRFSQIVDFRLYDPEHCSGVFLEDENI